MERAHVPVRFLRPLVELVANEENRTPASILHGTAISTDTLFDENGLVTFDQQVHLYERIADISTSSGLGFRSPAAQNFADQGMVGALMVLAPTVGEAFQKLEEFVDIIGAMQGYDVRIEADRLMLNVKDRASLSPAAHRLATEEILSVWKSANQAIPGLEPFLQEVRLDYSKPRHWKSYENLFPEAVVKFDQKELGAVLSSKVVDHPIQTHNPDGFRKMEKACVEIKNGMKPTVSGRVEQFLAENSPGNWYATKVANGLNMTQKMLVRRLRAEGTSTKRIIEQKKYNLALSLIGQLHTDSEIASKLGYSNKFSFARAFRKWAGKTPAAYRKKRLIDG